MLPVIDVGPLRSRTANRQVAVDAIRTACRDVGFFYVVNHGVDEALQQRLDDLSRDFFRRDTAEKMRIAMVHGGLAWRGYFPVEGEMTSGRPDLKEGIYFGAELQADHPDVRAGLPLHGTNLFPEGIPEFKQIVLDYLSEMTALGHALMEGIAASLGLHADYFAQHYTADPLVLFRIFHYPQPEPERVGSWGVGEHTDYGFLTILKQDHNGGLEVRTRQGWIAAPPIAGSFVCNIGDMLDRLTGGMFLSTLHRVRNTSGQSRLSFPFFFDPNFHAAVKPIPLPADFRLVENKNQRWDQASVHAFGGTYGEYLLGKIAKVFPALRQEVLPKAERFSQRTLDAACGE